MKTKHHSKQAPAKCLLRVAAAAAVLIAASSEAAPAPLGVDYLTAPFRQERILDWGNRPNWSADGRRIVFTKDDIVDGPAYEVDVKTRKVRCLTCKFDKAQFVTRIFYLPDDSFLIEATPGMTGGSGGGADAGRTELLWMSKDLATPVSLGTSAMGDIAISRTADGDGSVRIAWSAIKDKGLQLVTGKLSHDGRTARISDVQGLYEFQAGKAGPISIAEAYEFVDHGKAVMFWTVELNTLDGEMYKVDIATKAITKIYASPAHNETHTFPDERFGLEESNLLSDPDGPYRGISGLGKGGLSFFMQMKGIPQAAQRAAENADKGFDLAVVTMDGQSRRQLTKLSPLGAQAHQSVASPDGRRIAYAVKDPQGKSGQPVGLYVGTFGK